jgi:CAAX prenyl protease-like protein
MFNKILVSPVLVRVLPFALFAFLTLLQGRFGDGSQYWIYALKTVLGAWMLWIVWPQVKEMRWAVSWEAGAIGIFVFLAWVGLDGHYPLISARKGTFNPVRAYGPGSAFALFFICVRTVGCSLVVPPIEEVFYRSFVYRYLIKSDFLSIPLRRFDLRAFLIAGVAFGIAHFEWLPGILCACAYQWLVLRKNRLGDAITAHAITNFLLSLWVVFHPAYYFW